jgi:hypothetical protein
VDSLFWDDPCWKKFFLEIFLISEFVYGDGSGGGQLCRRERGLEVEGGVGDIFFFVCGTRNCLNDVVLFYKMLFCIIM